jgi:ribonuclease HII
LSGSTRKYEIQCYEQGYCFVAGIDEVGMGCLAGPVVAGAVIFNRDDFPRGIRDSKLLSHQKRVRLDEVIRKRALCFAIGTAEVTEIDTLNIYHASKLAMLRAVHGLCHVPDFLLLDGRGKIELCPVPQLCIVKGDRLSVSIGAASILAKVYRDHLMTQFDSVYPGYSFAKHKGYASLSHRQSIQTRGPTPIHRKSFSWSPV